MGRDISGLLALGGGNVVWEDLVLSDPIADEVIVKIEAASVCHTDISYARGNFVDRFPTLLGHEGVGRVIEKGEDARIEIGERVGITFALCGECRNCKLSQVAYCEKGFAVNFLEGIRGNAPVIFKKDGTPVHQFFGQSSLATEALVREHSLFRVPESLDTKLIAPIGCVVQTGAGAVMHEVKPQFVGLAMSDLSLVVAGCGGVGLSAIAAAHSLGVGEVLALDPNKHKLELALQMGADAVFSPESHSDREKLLGRADYYIEASGSPASLSFGFDVLKPVTSSLFIIGSPKLGTTVPLDVISMISGRVVKGIVEGSGSPEFCSRLAGEMEEGSFSIEKMITAFPVTKEKLLSAFAEEEDDDKITKLVLLFD